MNVIEAKNLNKNYGTLAALKQINFSVAKGQIVGIIGANGAGKTTLLKSILGLTHFQGNLSVLRLQPRKNRVQLMQHMCFIADVAILPRWITVEKAVDFVDGVHPHFDRKKAWNFLAKTNIKKKQKIKELSKGMVVQLHLALVMAIDVELLVLDEPTLGLDIVYRTQFYQTILDDYYHENRTIIITTHQVEEIEHLLTDLIIIDQGKLILQSSMEKLHENYIEVTVKQEQAQELTQFNPIFQRKEIGHIKYMFENVKKERLQQFGELSTPSISNIFLAKVGGGKNA